VTASIATNQTILVVGGGISGMTAALEAAECGKQVILVEKTPVLGGRTARLYRYFPKMCHPTCGLEINLRRIKQNRNIRLMTMTEVTAVSGSRGNYSVTLKVAPRFVNENCTACGKCAEAVSAEVANPWNYGLDKMKAAYLPHNMAYPQRYVIDPSIVGTPEGEKAKAACPVGAVDLEMKEETVTLQVGALIYATGWRPYDAAKIQPYGYGRFRNVITSLEFERLADPQGPTGGKILRPGDGKEAKNVAFIQCAGSRDENHLRHCSRICCMASLKQTSTCAKPSAKKANPLCITSTFAPSIASRISTRWCRRTRRSASSRARSRASPRMRERQPILHGVDTEGYHRYAVEHDLVVLAVGMEPEITGGEIARRRDPRFLELHRGQQGRRHVRRRRGFQPARRQSRGAKRHGRGLAACDPGHSQNRIHGGCMNAPATPVTPKYAAYICSAAASAMP
jgi:quinone-modifying oxidoreductase subunit QmoA